ncbi:MAG: kynureninase [Bacteroidota bacterium]
MPVQFEYSHDFARQLDHHDPLKSYRSRFHIPIIHGKRCAYFTGNSLGLQPLSTKRFVNEELNGWKTLGVEGHFASNKRPWFHYHRFSKDSLASIVGAEPEEVVSMNNLTSNLHFMMVSFYRPTSTRFKILIEGGAFPSDQYAVESQVKFHGFDPSTAIIELNPREGEYTLRMEDILSTIEQNGNELALIMMPGVQYYTGQFFDIGKITAAGHKVGANVGFDLAHAVGNVPLQLHDDQVDFAVWCSYKYLNSGPGGVAGAFVHKQHAHEEEIPRFAGWWGYNEEERFQMKKGFKPMIGADGWQVSNVNVLSSAAHLAALEIFDEVGMDALREKSIQLTGFLESLLKDLNRESELVKIITPSDPKERGCQLSLFILQQGKEVFEQLSAEGYVVDWREPNVIRVAPTPLYNTYEEVFQFVETLQDLLKK